MILWKDLTFRLWALKKEMNTIAKVIEYFQKSIKENMSHLKNEMFFCVQGTYRTPNTQDQKRNFLQHAIVKALKTQHTIVKVLKIAREKDQIIYNGRPIRITSDSLTEIFKAREAWKDGDNWEPRLLYPAKLCIKIKRERKTFHNENRLKEFMATKPVLQKYQKEYFILKRRTNTPKSSDGK